MNAIETEEVVSPLAVLEEMIQKLTDGIIGSFRYAPKAAQNVGI